MRYRISLLKSPRLITTLALSLVLQACGNSTEPNHIGYRDFYLKNTFYKECLFQKTDMFFQWPDYLVRNTDIYACSQPEACQVYINLEAPDELDSDCEH